MNIIARSVALALLLVVSLTRIPLSLAKIYRRRNLCPVHGCRTPLSSQRRDGVKTGLPYSVSLRGGANKLDERPKLSFAQNMMAGGLSRAAAQAACHPLNVCKTLLQSTGVGSVTTLSGLVKVIAAKPSILTRGLIEQVTCSVPNGAVNFATLELAKSTLVAGVPAAVQAKAGPVLNLLSSACGTLLSSVISVPQTVLLDRTMAGQYPNFFVGARRMASEEGPRAFYRGWTPAMGSKIPSYALTWALFQSLKGGYKRFLTHRQQSSLSSTLSRVDHRSSLSGQWVEDFLLGAMASGATVCAMIPMDTVKTRLTTQVAVAGQQLKYTGVVQCMRLVASEEGVGALYRALPPRLVSVVPMMGIQLCVYELVRRRIVKRMVASKQLRRGEEEGGGAQLSATPEDAPLAAAEEASG